MANKKRPARTVEVVRKQQLTPNMLRITLGGDELADFPADSDSAYIKLRMSEPDLDSEDKPVVRTYTVRQFDPSKQELDVDFVMHDVSGPAADWARHCSAGDTIRIMGPGPKKLVDYQADWFLLVGDMSALPAISANIEGMPESARGYALLEVIENGDRQTIRTPPGLQVSWIINAHPDEPNTHLLDAVRSIDWLDGTASIWVAGEISQSLAIRKYLKAERHVQRQDLYASSYWQIGRTEDGHRISKAKLAEEQ